MCAEPDDQGRAEPCHRHTHPFFSPSRSSRDSIIQPPSCAEIDRRSSALARHCRGRLLSASAESRGRRVVEKAAQHGDGVHQSPAIRDVQCGELRLDRADAVGPDPVERVVAFGGDLDAHCASIAGVDGPGNQASVFETSHLRGHGRLRAVVHRGQVADSRFALGVDGRQQAGLRGGQLHLDALGGVAVETGDDSEQIRAQTSDSLLGGVSLYDCG